MVIFATYRRRKLVIPLTLNKQLISLKKRPLNMDLILQRRRRLFINAVFVNLTFRSVLGQH